MTRGEETVNSNAFAARQRYDRELMRTVLSFALSAVLVLAPSSMSLTATDEGVELVRVPNGGIQPEIAVDRTGVVHMLYLSGEPGAANIFYVRSSDGGKSFSRAVRVNSQEGSAIATGTIRGAQIAIARNGTVHVAWNGSDKALPKPPVNPKTKRAGMPMLYTRSNAAGTAFEPQRNLMSRTTNLDGGGSIAADERGGIYVAWHGNSISGEGGEDARRVWIARSTDDGVTFGRERPVSDPATGVCGCCALRLAATVGGELRLLYRSATDKVHRDIYSLVSRDRGRTFEGGRVQAWEIGACPMTSMSIVAGGQVLRAWETDGQVYFNSTAAGDPPKAPPATATSESMRRKHPRLAVNQKGTVLLAWTDGTAWGRGGSLAWQAFGADGRPTAVKGTQPGIPVWSFTAVLARPDGGFAIFY
jgi:hypothetical protein